MTQTEMTTLGARIRDARKQAGFKNAESFAVALGVGVRTVQRWESNSHDPTIERLIAVARLLDKPLDWFFAGNGEVA